LFHRGALLERGENIVKKIVFSRVFLSILLFALAGCGSRYSAEKLYWQANQVAGRLSSGNRQITAAQYQKIISAYRRVAQRYPLEPLAAQSQFTIAQIYTIQGKFEQAQAELGKIVNNFSRDKETASRAQFMIGNLYEQQGNWEMAAQEYEKVFDLYPLSSYGLRAPVYIAEHYQKSDPAQAEKAYRRAVRGYEKLINDYSGTSVVPVIRNYLGAVYVSQGKWDDALAVWQETLNEYPQSPIGALSLFSIGELYKRQIKDLQKAIEVYEDFVSKYPESQIIKQAKFQIARLYLLKEDFSKAKAAFKEIADTYPQDKELCAFARLSLAACADSEGRWYAALKEYDKLMVDYPDSSAALQAPLLIAQHYIKVNLPDKAENAFREAIAKYENIISRSPQSRLAMEAQDLITLSRISQKEWQKAVESMQVLIKNYPDNPKAITSLFAIAAIYHKQMNLPEKAAEAYAEFIEKYPGHFLAGISKTQLKTLAGALISPGLH
jgi:TolA-binding protein